MLALLIALATHSTGWEHVIYICKPADSGSEFNLVYDRRGSVIKNVRVVDRGSPRLPPDNLTRWRGKVDGQGAIFDFHLMENGFWTSGEMRLAPTADRTGHFVLTWSSMMSGAGSDIPMGTPDESANCTLK